MQESNLPLLDGVHRVANGLAPTSQMTFQECASRESNPVRRFVGPLLDHRASRAFVDGVRIELTMPSLESGGVTARWTTVGHVPSE